MLGAAEAQTTIGLNFQQWYYDSGNNPQTVGSCNGYSTYNATGMPVSATAFGVSSANWNNTDPIGSQYNGSAISQLCTFGGTATTFAGGLSCFVNSPAGTRGSGIGCPFASGSTYPAYTPGEFTTPGNNEVWWGNIQGSAASPFSISVSGLAAKFPNGYVIQAMGAKGGYSPLSFTNLADVFITDGTTTNDATYHCTVVNNPSVAQWGQTMAGISDVSGTFTADTIYLQSQGDDAALSGFVVTDVPVVTYTVTNTVLLASGASLTLPPPPGVIGVGLTYQWQLNGTNLPGATFSSYTNASAQTSASGIYQAVVTSSYYPGITATGVVASVSVVPPHAARTAYWDPLIAGAASDGSGTWGFSATDWWSGTNDDYWGAADSAVFGAGGAGAYTVTLGVSISANAITFNSGVYNITNSAGQTLTLNGLPAVTANTNATISVPLTIGTNTFVKAGTGALTLTANLGSTNILVSAGTLTVQTKITDAPYIVTNGASLKIGYSTGGGYANTKTLVYGSGASATSGLYLAGGKTYNTAGELELLGAPSTIRQYGSGYANLAIFDINGTGLYCSAAASGSATDPNIDFTSEGYGMAFQVDAGTNTALGDMTFNGPLNAASLGFYKRGAGSLLLNAAALPGNNSLQLQAGTVICGATNCIGTNAFLNVGSGGTLIVGGTSQTVSNAVFNGTLVMTINRGGSTGISQLTSWGQGFNYGGTLIVTNIGGAPQLGDTFTLFNSTAGYANSFGTIVLPAVANGLAWQNNLSSSGSFTVIVGSTPPSIVTDLTGATNYAFAGGGAVFNITAAGDPVLEYQWLKNGTTPVGANSSTLTLTSVTTGSQGYYSAVVTNNYGSAYSQSNYLAVVTPSGVTATAVSDTPLSFWPLSETNGTTAYDYWSGNNGTNNGTITMGATGPASPAYPGFGSGTVAYQFDGSSGYIGLGTNASISGTTPFTVEAWINTTNSTNSMVIVQQRYTGSGYIGEYGFTVNANGTLGFYIYGSGGYQFSFGTPTLSRRVNDGNWHHVAAVRTSTNGLIYVDGSLAASASGAAQALTPSIPVFIGADLRNSANYFSGSMCNVAIYNTALSATRIGAHATSGWLGTSPLTISTVSGGWIEDSKPVGTLLDAENLGVGWLATSTDSVSVTRTNVATFQAGAQIAIPPNAAFNSPTGTICFWMQLPYPATGHGGMLFDRRTSTGLVMTSDGTLGGQIYVQWSGYTNTLITTGTFVEDGNWHHVALVYDQSITGSVTVYVDGNQVGTQANVSAWSWPTGQEIELGRSHDTYWQEFTGTMSDFRMYSRPLLGSEISTLATPATSDSLIDTSTLVVRYNFGTAAGVGTGLAWPIGVLQNASVLGQPTVWTPIGTTSPVYPYIPRAGTTNATSFYGIKL